MSLNKKIQQLHSLNESIWYDNISRQLIKSGQLENLVGSGITGVTSNPSIFEKSISSSDEYDSSIYEYTNEGLGPEQLAIYYILHIYKVILLMDLQVSKLTLI